MKKRLIVFWAFIMLIALVACGTDSSKDVVNNEVNQNNTNVNNSEDNGQENESNTEAETEEETEGENFGESEEESDVESENDDSSNNSGEYEFEGVYWGEGPDDDMDGEPDGKITRIYYFDGEKCTISSDDSTDVYEYTVKSVDGSSTIEFYEDGSLYFDKEFFMLDGRLCFTFQDVDFGGYIQCVIVDDQYDFE